MPRLTRAERQEQTRAELLLAARSRFLARGYAATSLDDIADDAGFSKGAVYSNFGSKPNLCREVLASIHREKLGEMSRLAGTDADLTARIAAVNDWLERTAGDVGWTMLELEFVVLSRNNPELGAMITALRADAAQMVTAVLRTLADDLDPDTAASIDDFGNLLLSAGIGLGIQRAIDPSLSTRPVADAITRTMNLLAALGASR
ncbi:TetR/AcrR family transcriptional regulator [Mycolicibacterium bacteremicum]|uniref:TetR family transcriptional regulator n=1 Tax=Mycolicibacterium bacteremicum TaxID=564198 RepID=A0A1W9Z1T4_MYCBA|nr:TetR/AcrR family transcriptional regulator [Mycolicibacterium bacteremicum]MCV7433130.1 TetR/AcrR family transcriptional regulator [Mycolicibacterium bacteremicum]ORA06281.1 TetR family transcriptional regulator [Mycolicibacterium bacteremicum]